MLRDFVKGIPICITSRACSLRRWPREHRSIISITTTNEKSAVAVLHSLSSISVRQQRRDARFPKEFYLFSRFTSDEIFTRTPVLRHYRRDYYAISSCPTIVCV